jgi:integrase
VRPSGNLTLADLTLQNGIGQFQDSFGGGEGILNQGVLTIVDSVIKRNGAGPQHSCGGIESSGTLTIVRSTVTENGADVNGGGLCGGAATLILDNSIIANNSTFSGGGIAGGGGPMIVHNSTIARNFAKDGRGAGVQASSQVTFINSTIAGNFNNDSTPGAGIDGPATLINTYRDKRTGQPKTVDVWWVEYFHRGRQHRESSHSTSRTDAVDLLKKRLGEIGRGRLIGPNVEKTTFEQLKAMLIADYKSNGRRSLDRAEDAVQHLATFFAETRAVDITTDRVLAYTAFRREEKAGNATINRELAALKRMFRLGEQACKVAQRPHIHMLEERNARKGFFEEDDFRAVLRELPEALRPIFEVAYLTGWRIKSEILSRQWQHVDFRAGWLRLEPGETKNGDGRMFPLGATLRAVLERQREETEALAVKTGRIVPWIFHRNGRPIRSLRRAWTTACLRAGFAQVVCERPRKVRVPGIPHDFRRTAVRNLERAGVPRSAAMKMVGHKTEAIYRRYAIADEGMLRDAAAKLEQLHQADRLAPRTVIALAETRR